ncbi:MAG TPA: CBS domain-containing protein, partial [Polyangia bacterium]|nr:CBS domain-containing protein [Polyangia bacterium]
MAEGGRGTRISDFTISPDASIADALARMDAAGAGALALCAADRRLAAFLTDGDIRRAVLRGVSTADACETIANHSPLVVLAPVSSGEALHLMMRNDVNHLP